MIRMPLEQRRSKRKKYKKRTSRLLIPFNGQEDRTFHAHLCAAKVYRRKGESGRNTC